MDRAGVVSLMTATSRVPGVMEPVWAYLFVVRAMLLIHPVAVGR